MSWTIEAKVQPLVGIAGHLYLDIFDDEGKRVVQINGFSFSDRTNKITSIGTPEDKLKAYVTDKVVLVETSGRDRDHQPHDGHVIFSGKKEDVLEVIAALNVTEKIHVFWIVTHIFTVFLAAQRQLSDGLLDLFWQGIYISFILFLNLFFFYGALGLFVPLPFLPADTALTVKTALTGVFYMALYLTNLTYLPYLLWRRFFRH